MSRAIRALAVLPRIAPDGIGLASAIGDLSDALLEASGDTPGPPARLAAARLDRAEELMRSVIHRRLAVDEIERAAGLSRWELSRQFGRRHGAPLDRFHLLRRLERAKDLLAKGRRIADAALGAGFADQAHLTRAFRSAFGLTPAQWRRLGRAAVGRTPPGRHTVHVRFAERDGEEIWTRQFGTRRFSSRLSEAGGDLVERCGPLRFRFALAGGPDGLAMEIVGWSAFGVPMPLSLAPRSRAREWEEDGRFRFDVPIALPLLGRIVRYRGWLAPAAPAAAGTSAQRDDPDLGS